MEGRVGVPREADEHVHVGSVEGGHQQVASHPHELEERHLSLREPLDHRVRRAGHPAIRRTP